MHKLALISAMALTSLLVGCSRQDQASVQQANDKANAEAHKLSVEAKQEAHKLGNEIGKGMNGPVTPSSAEADRKLHEAGKTLDQAALTAAVKTKMAADVGLSTVSAVRVDVTGSVVTLSGTTATAEQRQAAEQSAAQVNGISHVIDNIRVQAEK